MQHLNEETLVVRNESIPTGEVDGELVALDLDKGQCFGMDNVGARIWNIAADPVSVGAIVERLTASHDVTREQCMRDVLPFVSELLSEGLLRRLPE